MSRKGWPRFLKLEGEEMKIGNDARRAQADVTIGDADPEKTQPRPQHVAAIETAHRVVAARARRRLRLGIEKSANEMTQRMAAERVTAQQYDVDDEHERTDR